MALTPEPLYLQNLNLISAAHGETIHGVLGVDFLRDYQLIIDSDNHTFSIRVPRPVKAHQAIPIHIDSRGLPHLKITGVNPASPKTAVNFIVDTGAVGTSTVRMQSSLFDSLVEHDALQITSTGQSATLYGVSQRRIGIATECHLLAIHSRLCISETSTALDTNLLGMGYLTQFNVVIDFPNSKLYVSPRKTPGMPLDLQDCSGFGFVREQGMIVIKRVEPASPAFKADLRLDDAILAVNGVAGEKIDLYQLRLELCQPGKDVKLKIRRNRREHSVTLHLEDWNKPVTADDFE